MVAAGAGRPSERALGFVARSIFWLGLVYSNMPFDNDSRRSAVPTQAVGPVASPGPVAACAQGMSETCRAAVERLRLAADIAAVSFGAGDALRKAAATSRLADPRRSKDKLPPTQDSR
jgi:hypothetical protein